MGTQPPSKQGGGTAPGFRLMSVVAKRLDGWRCHLVRITEVDLGPGHIVLDVDSAPPAMGTAAPLFSASVYCGHDRPSQLELLFKI